MPAINGQHYGAQRNHHGMWFTGPVPSDGDLRLGPGPPRASYTNMIYLRVRHGLVITSHGFLWDVWWLISSLPQLQLWFNSPAIKGGAWVHDHIDLAATKKLYGLAQSVPLSVRLSICLFVIAFSLCSHHCIIMKFSEVITNDRSNFHATG